MIITFSSSFKSKERIGLFCIKASTHLFKVSYSKTVFFSFVVWAFFAILSNLFWAISKSAKTSSTLIISISSTGSILPETWIIFSSSKQRTTSTMASTSLIWDKNLLPSPSPFEAPLTRPAISVNSKDVGTVLFGTYNSSRKVNLESGTVTTPTLGSMVANG